MVRFGQQSHSVTAARFIPQSQQAHSSDLQEVAKADGLSSATTAAAALLDGELESLKESATDGTDFFQTLVAVFSELRNESQSHLSNFYLSLPALMLSFAEQLMHSKEKLSRRGKDGMTASFTDDGFALGVSYILRVLGQDTAFDSLHWFDSAESHFAQERARITEEGARIKETATSRWSRTAVEEESANEELRLGKLRGLEAEMRLLQFSFVGARTFFNPAS